MKYFFVPGRISNLAVAELRSLLTSYYGSTYSLEHVSDSLIIVDINKPKEQIDRLFSRLGGFIKYGEFIEDLDSFLNDFIDTKKIIFGVSVLENQGQVWTNKKIKDLSEEIKKGLKSLQITARYILPRHLELNAAQVIKNRVIQKGFELNIFTTKGKSYYGITNAVQDIDLFSLIDYGKPYTDKKMGVLPAKLARILINLSGVKEGETVWDPFCGSGTIPLTALVSGINTIGTDIDQRAIQFTKENIEWLSKQNIVGNVKFDAFILNILKPDYKLLRDLENTDIHTIVCEPFMGPPQFRVMSSSKANELLESVSSLYTALFGVVEEIKKRDIRMVIIVPSFKTRDGWATMSVNRIVGKQWEIENKKYGGDLHWMRPNSIIKRNIFILSKKR